MVTPIVVRFVIHYGDKLFEIQIAVQQCEIVLNAADSDERMIYIMSYFMLHNLIVQKRYNFLQQLTVFASKAMESAIAWVAFSGSRKVRA